MHLAVTLQLRSVFAPSRPLNIGPIECLSLLWPNTLASLSDHGLESTHVNKQHIGDIRKEICHICSRKVFTNRLFQPGECKILFTPLFLLIVSEITFDSKIHFFNSCFDFVHVSLITLFCKRKCQNDINFFVILFLCDMIYQQWVH